MCNVKPFGAIQTFQDTTDFHECGECSPKVHSGSFHFIGFPLLNHGDINLYKEVETKDDCQVLCNLANGCNFFNYNSDPISEYKGCYLKFGVGKKLNHPDIYFGEKKKRGISSINPRKNDHHGLKNEHKAESKQEAGGKIWKSLRMFFFVQVPTSIGDLDQSLSS